MEKGQEGVCVFRMKERIEEHRKRTGHDDVVWNLAKGYYVCKICGEELS